MTTALRRMALVSFSDLWRDDLSQRECRQRSLPTSDRSTGVVSDTLRIALQYGTQPRSGLRPCGVGRPQGSLLCRQPRAMRRNRVGVEARALSRSRFGGGQEGHHSTSDVAHCL